MKRNKLKSKAICLGVCCAIQLTWILPIGIRFYIENQTSIDTQTEKESETFLEEETEADVTISVGDINNTVTCPKEEVETETEEEFVSVSYIPIYIQKLCFEIGEQYNIEPGLIIAIIERESSGRVNAVNKDSGCMGLMQLHPKYANYYLKKTGGTDPFDAEDNIRAGCAILKEKIKQYKHLPLAIMKYHGESNAKKKFRTGNYSAYCVGILERMEQIKKITGG